LYVNLLNVQNRYWVTLAILYVQPFFCE
jgi:hypothetical protein